MSSIFASRGGIPALAPVRGISLPAVPFSRKMRHDERGRKWNSCRKKRKHTARSYPCLRMLLKLPSLCFSVLALFALTAAPAIAADAQNWPQFKGDAQRTGDNSQAVLKLPLAQKVGVRFAAPIYASPAVVGNRVYVQDALGNVACIDRRQNQVLWKRHLGGFNNTSSPAVRGDYLYIGSATGALFVLNAMTGEEIKRLGTDGPVLTAPAVVEDAVYFSTLGGKLYKMRPDGEVVWNFDGGATSVTEIAAGGGRVVFFAGTDNTLQYLLRDAGDHAEVETKRESSGQTCPTSGPVLVGDTDYAYTCFDSEFGTFFLSDRVLEIDTCDTRATPSVRGRRLFRGDKTWDLADLDPESLKQHPQRSGKLLKPAWRADRSYLYDGGFHASPALTKDKLVIGSELGRLLVFSLEPDADDKPLFTFATSRAGKVNGAISSSPAVIDGHVFFGGEDGILYGLGPGESREIVELEGEAKLPCRGEDLEGNEWHTVGGDQGFSCVADDSKLRPPLNVKWRTRVWSTFKCPMIVAEGKVFASGRSGALMALDAANGRILWKSHHPGVESRAAPTYANGKLFLLRAQGAQGDSPHVVGPSGGPRGEGVWCHDATTGRKLWHRPMPFAYHFNADGLVAFGGKVFCCQREDDGHMAAVALSAKDGRIVWKKRFDDLETGRRPRRFSGALAGGLWCVSLAGQFGKSGSGATYALHPDTGEIVWKNSEISIYNRSRVAARNGVLVVFNQEGAHALDAKTGKLLWQGVGAPEKGSTATSYYMQALTDRYLKSEGKQGVFAARGCAFTIFAGGVWYSHDTRTRWSSNLVVGKTGSDEGENIVWEHPFLSNACPSPAPAYDHLFYAPNAEGVIYCFQAAEAAD